MGVSPLFVFFSLKILYKLKNVLPKAFRTLATIGIVRIKQVTDCVPHIVIG